MFFVGLIEMIGMMNIFYKQDIIDLFERIKILMEYGCLPYIMKFNKYVESPYKGTYINVSSWCNQPSFLKRNLIENFVSLISKELKQYALLWDI